MRRFWREAAAVPRPEGFAVELDGKPVRLPGGGSLMVFSRRLADAMAEEWAELPEEFSLEQLRLTRLAGTAQERVAANAGSIATALARYAETDVLCYRAERPAELVERQQRSWQPWLDWADRRHGARLQATTGLRHLAQDHEALARLAAVVARCDDFTMAGMGVLVPALGSLVLALAIVDGALAPAEASALANLDETFQAEQWGQDAEAVVRRGDVAEDVALASRFIELSRP